MIRIIICTFTLVLFCISCNLKQKQCPESWDKCWHYEGKEYERFNLVGSLFDTLLTLNVERDTITKILGEPEISICDSIYWEHGTIRDGQFDNLKSSLIVRNNFAFEMITNTPCSDKYFIDRYVIGFNGSGPDYMALIYENKLTYKFLRAVQFERSEW